MDEPPFALVCGWRYPLLIIAKGGSFSTVSTLRLYSSTSLACGFSYEVEHLRLETPQMLKTQVQIPRKWYSKAEHLPKSGAQLLLFFKIRKILLLF